MVTPGSQLGFNRTQNDLFYDLERYTHPNKDQGNTRTVVILEVGMERTYGRSVSVMQMGDLHRTRRSTGQGIAT
jgi:hypothetical protein